MTDGRAQTLLLKNLHRSDSATLEAYLQGGGYRALARALKEMTPEQVVEEVKASGLRGRGGAGFPTGMKWGFMPKGPGPKYLVLNADESEPGTFKDRLLLERDPHLVLEGFLIGCYAVGCHHGFIYIRGEFVRPYRILLQAVQEARARGYVGKNLLGSGYDLEITVYRGAGAYICGEETALLESLEGKLGHPRLKPPFPAQVGLYGKPTSVNNVETVANVPMIVEMGANWYGNIGRPKNTGPKLFCLSGHVRRPGVYEFPLGIPLRELIYQHAGGMLRDDRPLKAVVPGGSSVPVLRADQIDVLMDFDSLAAAGTLLGSAGVIVMDDSVCMVDALLNLARFYAHESCGQCTPCREGTGWYVQILERLERGAGRKSDLDLLLDLSDRIQGNTICPLGDAVAMPVRSYVTQFREEFEEHVATRRCPRAAAAAPGRA
ncbi:MAG TPA: NADH-quinone oxidoreductase subunit NuoF [Candidatus Polarisedimenticolia bacterium]|jgi:NADH-quinone oxidoreductase subunit F|nr:NADH-quinone oxidoreductase subunit NuoF [Candidatus Polarisedimenticolia bacterium]